MARGFNVAEQGHVVSLFSPVSHSTAASSEVFSMEGWAHCTIILHKGVGSASTIVLEECSAFAGTGHRTFTPYKYAQEATASGDTLDAAMAAGTTAGVAIPTGTNTFLIFEVDADALSDGYQYLRIKHNACSASIWGAVAILTGGRYQEDITATAIV